MSATPSKTTSLQTRLSLFFGALCLLMLISLGVTIIKGKQVDGSVTNIVEESVPTAFAANQLASDVNASIAALRGWVLTSDESFKTQRQENWARILENVTRLDELTGRDENTLDPENWNSLKSRLTSFRQAQDKVEAIAHTPDDRPASKILNEQVTPLTDSMLSSISQVFIQEITQPATPERKSMMAMMGDVRGAIAVVSGNIRAYLLTGQQHYIDQYQAVWGWAQGRLGELDQRTLLLSNAQLSHLNEFKESLAQVNPLFDQLIEIRSGDQWNISRAMMVRDVIPLADQILTQLADPQNGIVALKAREMEQAGAQAQSATWELTNTSYVLAFVALVLAIVMVMLSSKTIIAPVREMTAMMTKLADGIVEITIPGLERTDEIGAMARALSVFKRNREERLRLEEAQDAERQKREERAKHIEELSLNFDQSIRAVLENTTQATDKMYASAQSMQTTAQSTLAQTKSVAEATHQTNGNVEQVASATSELSQSFNRVSENASTSVQVIEAAIQKGQNASKTVNWMSEASRQIGEVVQMIDDIAAKTNLLALNATVEASRAGEAGKGFSVVAGEVKNLANQTARATHQISENIQTMQERTDKSVAAIRDVLETITHVGDMAANVRDTVMEQNQATQNITGNVEDVAGNAGLISNNIERVETAASETSTAATDMMENVEDVSAQAKELKKEVESFLNALKSA